MATVATTLTGINGKRSTVKHDTIREIEKQMQKRRTDLKVLKADAPNHNIDK
jgi:hypothetical protein